jgi:hypothetical protein
MNNGPQNSQQRRSEKHGGEEPAPLTAGSRSALGERAAAPPSAPPSEDRGARKEPCAPPARVEPQAAPP